MLLIYYILLLYIIIIIRLVIIALLTYKTNSIKIWEGTIYSNKYDIIAMCWPGRGHWSLLEHMTLILWKVPSHMKHYHLNKLNLCPLIK